MEHFTTFSNTLGQLYPWPSRAHSLLPLNLPNYASHELFSHSIAVISEPHTLCFSFSTTFYISFHLLSSFLGLSLLPCTLFCFLFHSTPLLPTCVILILCLILSLPRNQAVLATCPSGQCDHYLLGSPLGLIAYFPVLPRHPSTLPPNPLYLFPCKP